MTFAIGDTVKSQPVGSKESFVGTIVEEFTNGPGGVRYNVRDGFNKRWQRAIWELEAVN